MYRLALPTTPQLHRRRATFLGIQYAIKAYLALRNMLAPMNDPSLPARLLSLDRQEFVRWLAEVERGSSTQG